MKNYKVFKLFFKLSILMLVSYSSHLKAQDNVGIGTNTPDASAKLEILASNKGLLVPRMTTTGMNAIVNPANSLLIYNTDSMCYFFYRQPTTSWISMCISQENSSADSLYVNYSYIDSLFANYTSMDSLFANYVNIDSLFTNYINVDSLFASYTNIDSLFASYMITDSLFANYVNVDSLFSNFIHSDSLFSNYASIDSIFSNYINVDSLFAHYMTTDSLFANYANIDSLFANYFNADSIISHYISTDTLLSNYADIDSLFANYIYTDSIFANYGSFDSLTIGGTSIQSLIDSLIAVSDNDSICSSATTNYITKFTSPTSICNSLLFDNGTNVGIGTTIPDVQFSQQYGAFPASFSNSITDFAYMIKNTGNVNVFGIAASTTPQRAILMTNNGYDLNLGVSGTIGMTLATNNNIGIGTTNPGKLLDLNSSSVGGTAIQLVNTSVGGQSWSVLSSGSGNSEGAGKLSFVESSGGGGSLNARIMTLQTNGNVGIGTMTPNSPLEVKGQVSAPSQGVLITTSAFSYGSSGSYIRLGHGVSSGNTYGQIDNLIAGGTAMGNLILQAGAGNVGIGTINPVGALDVFKVNTGVTQSNAGGLIFQVIDGLSRPPIQAFGNIDGVLPNGTGAAIFVRQQSGTGRSINASGTINASGADYAEYFYQEQPGSLQKTDVACLGPDGKVRKCSEGDVCIGIVSSTPGFVGNDIYDEKNPEATALIGLTGQVPVKISLENGPIKTGDFLTPSLTKPGYAMKATTAVRIIGVALETKISAENKILAFVNVGYWDPGTEIKEVKRELQQQQTIINQLKEEVEKLKSK